MALVDDIRSLRDRVLADLTDAYDYHTDTKIAWKIVERFIETGHTITNRSMTTGTVTTHNELAEKARRYITKELTEATFQQFISIFENFFFEILRLWLTTYPNSLGKKTLDFNTILKLPDKNAITGLVVEKELNEVKYDRPAEWFAYLDEKVKLGCPTTGEVERFSEAKATRDILVHNMVIATKIYESKAGKLARFRDGERIQFPDHYHRETWELIRKLVSDISNSAAAKAE